MGTTRPTRPTAPAGHDIDLADESEPSIGELLGRTASDLSQLMRDEVELAKVEIKEEAKTLGRASALLAGAGLLAYLALGLVCIAAAWGLAEVLPPGVAFLIVGVVVGVAAAITYAKGRKNLEAFQPVPEQTVETIQEDVQWARQLTS
jgi:uncharacterized membrane protein YqjE